MSKKLTFQPYPGQPTCYQIRLAGQLGCEWTDWFDGMSIALEENGDTLLIGPVPDQAALHGLFKKVRDLGLTLVSVKRVEPNQAQHCHSIKGENMNSNKQTIGMDSKVKLSLLWIFVVLNMAYADILSLMDATSPIRKVMAGDPMPSGGLMAGAILMETAIAMVILSWLLKYGVNRWVNIIIGAINIFAVTTGGHGLYYLFFAAIEVVCMVLIIWFAWKWKPTSVADIN